MVTEVALILVSCVLFIQMGLSEAVQTTLRVRVAFLSCPKCLTFWSCFPYLLFSGHGFLLSVATSFLCAYSALWLSLLYDIAATAYNNKYEQILSTPKTGHTTGKEAGSTDNPQAGGHGVS